MSSLQKLSDNDINPFAAVLTNLVRHGSRPFYAVLTNQVRHDLPNLPLSPLWTDFNVSYIKMTAMQSGMQPFKIIIK